MLQRPITRSDLLSISEYARVRPQRRREIAEIKRHRRVAVGPDITFYFENFSTMLHQVHEMLHIEKGGDDQIDDELKAYNPLIPDGTNLVATLMIEIDDPIRRAKVLRSLAGVEETISLDFAGWNVAAVPETDEERTTPDGKTSSVHFVKFPFDAAQRPVFATADVKVVLAISHPAYGHMAVLPEDVRASLAADFS